MSPSVDIAAGPAPPPIAEPSRLNEDRESSKSVAAVLQAIAEQVGGDSLLATWHEFGRAPSCLMWHGHCFPGAGVAEEMVAAADRFAQEDCRLDWCMSTESPGGITIMSIPVDGGMIAVTSWFRQTDDMALSLAHDAASRRRVLEPFFRLWAHHRKSISRAMGLARAFDRLDVATFHFDSQGRLLFGNEAGQALIATRDGLRRAESSLGGSTLADTIALQSAIDDVVDAGAGNASSVVALTRPGRRPLLATVAATGSGHAIPGATAVVVYVVDPDQDRRSRLEPVCGLYNLSPVETRLACLLTDGSSLTEAADQIHVREQTARSYLKSIFAKTGTTRQGELVGLLLKSAFIGCRSAG